MAYENTLLAKWQGRSGCVVAVTKVSQLAATGLRKISISGTGPKRPYDQAAETGIATSPRQPVRPCNMAPYCTTTFNNGRNNRFVVCSENDLFINDRKFTRFSKEVTYVSIVTKQYCCPRHSVTKKKRATRPNQTRKVLWYILFSKHASL